MKAAIDCITRWVLWLICILALLSPLWLPRLAQAGDLTEEQAYSILIMAYGACPQLEGQENGCPRELLDNPPTIHIVAQDKICEMMSKHPGCSYVGAYDTKDIYLSDKLNFATAYGASVLFHELLHHFQQKLRGDVQDCLEYVNREREAYMIQGRYLAKAGEYGASRMVMMSGQMLRCR